MNEFKLKSVPGQVRIGDGVAAGPVRLFQGPHPSGRVLPRLPTSGIDAILQRVGALPVHLVRLAVESGGFLFHGALDDEEED